MVDDVTERPLGSSGNWSYFGAAEPDLIVAGHSHAEALRLAQVTGEGLARHTSAVAYTSSTRRLGPPGDSEYWGAVSELAAGKALAISWNGNQHAAFLLERDSPLRLAASRSATDDSPVVPEELIRELWKPTVEGLRVYLARMSGASRVFVLGTPPPKSDDVCRELVGHEQFFLDELAAAGVELADVKITPAATRVQLWSIIQDLTREVAAEFGVTFVPVPAQTQLTTGVLRPEFSGGDVTHANVQFGAAMFRDLEVALERASVVS